MTAPDTSPGGPKRAIWGLVNDGYALVAKTANLSYDEAFELCRVPDIGDPSAYLDSGLAFLRAPKWGRVFARYFTNADRDSAGRASLVYDVVALSDDEFAALGNDAFAALPPLARDHRPERFGELPIPTPVPRDEATSAARLAELLETEDQGTITTLLAALLAGDRVLSFLPGVREETIECLTLLLPPWLRPALTFQIPTVDVPKHTPRLTVADRPHALLVEREWTAMLPRDAADPRFTEPAATAARLVALGKTGDRLHRAWAVGAVLSAEVTLTEIDLGAEIAAILRMDLIHEGLRCGDLRRAVLVTARAASEDERIRLTDALFRHAAPDRVAAALADVARGEQRGAWSAVQAISLAVGLRRDEHRERFTKFFSHLLDGLHAVPRPSDDDSARASQVTLACAAAALGDLDRFLDVADPALPWEAAWHNGTARWVKGRSQVARLFDALAARGTSYADAVDGVNAIAAVVASATGRARERASAIGLVLVRRTFRERALLEPLDKLGPLADGLVRIWLAATPAPGATPPEDAERALRRLFGVGEPLAAGGDPRRLAAELSRTIGDAPGGEVELVGWIVAALDRAHAGATGDAAVRVATALLEEAHRFAPRSELAAHVERVLLHFAATDAAFVFRPGWLDLVRRVDDMVRRELLARALAWVARGYASGRFTIGALVDACVASGAEGGTIDGATVALLESHLVTAVQHRGNATELALLTGVISGIATPNAAERLTEALLGAVDESVSDGIRMRRLALALHEVEQVRDEERFADARAALRRATARHALSPDEERALCTFLGVDNGTFVGRLLGKLPSLTTGGAVVTSEGR
ncbi:MAG TPA: hypothetical protein VFW03_09190 [Gemmatimonadaceae bacterium]|nr:hypothetical protein [Gemmatimonadaceae bacterium]